MQEADKTQSELCLISQPEQYDENELLIITQGDTVEYILPAYLRMTVRKVSNIELSSSSAQAAGTLIFTVYYGGLPSNQQFIRKKPKKNSQKQTNEQQQQQLWYIQQLMNKMQLTVNSQDSWTFASQTDMFYERALKIKNNQKNKQISYTIRNTFETEIEGNIHLTPFETLDCFIQFSLRTIQSDWVTKEGNKKVQLKFNFMDTLKSDKLRFKQIYNSGQYAVAEKMSSMVFIHAKQQYKKNKPQTHKNVGDILEFQKLDQKLSESKNTENKNTENKQIFQKQLSEIKKAVLWQHCHVKIILYKHPFTTIFSIMMPMWILAIIVQLAFFQQNDLGGTIASVGMAIVAYMAFIPSVRQKLPPSPQFTFIEGVISLLLFTSMLCVVRGFIIHDLQDYEYNWKTDPIFIISLILNVLTFALTLLLLAKFYLWDYTKYGKNQEPSSDFKRKDWSNKRALYNYKKFLTKLKLKEKNNEKQ